MPTRTKTEVYGAIKYVHMQQWHLPCRSMCPSILALTTYPMLWHHMTVTLWQGTFLSVYVQHLIISAHGAAHWYDC